VLSESFELFVKQLKVSEQKDRLNTVIKVALVLVFGIFVYKFCMHIINIDSTKNFYPSDRVVNYLVKNVKDKEIFSEYDWGGYLIWKLPAKKVFVDGRMPSWRWDAPPYESDWAFQEHEDIISGKKDYKLSFKKYNIGYVLLQKKNRADFENKIIRVFVNGKKERSLESRLAGEGWVKVFEDEAAVIYKN
jgi:hypothetical protein